MKRLFTTNYSAGAFNTAMFLLRFISGFLMIHIGYGKLVHFDKIKGEFMNFMGLGSSFSLGLTIFAEFFCSLLIILGLFTRAATIPLIITMCVIIFKVNHSDFFDKGQLPVMYLAAFLTILILGPGKASIDNMIGK